MVARGLNIVLTIQRAVIVTRAMTALWLLTPLS